MKTILLALSLAAAGVSSAHAQLFQPTITRDTVLGAVAGALIGGHNHDRWAEGAVIGAAAGALVGATVDQPRTVVYSQPPVTVMRAAPVVVTSAPQVVYVEQAPPVRVVRVVQPAPVVYYAAPPAVVVVAPTRYYVSPRYAYGYGYGYRDRYSR